MFRLFTRAFHHAVVPEVQHKRMLTLNGTSVTWLCWRQQWVPVQLRPESDSPREPFGTRLFLFFFLFQVKFKSSQLHLTQWLSHVYVFSYFHQRNCFCLSLRVRLVSPCASEASSRVYGTWCLWQARLSTFIAVCVACIWFENTVNKERKINGCIWADIVLGFRLLTWPVELINLFHNSGPLLNINIRLYGRKPGSHLSLLNLTATFPPYD